LHRLAAQEIRQALQPFGYYGPKIDAKLEKLEGVWQASYAIDRGSPTELDRVDIRVRGEGGDDPSVKDVLSSIELVSGQPLEHRQYEQAKSRLSSALYDAGFIDAKFTRSEIKVYPLKRKAEITLIAESGPRFSFGPVTIEQDILRSEFVNRFVNIQQGDRFETRKLIDLQLALNGSDYFSQIEILAERENAVGTQIPVTVNTEPNKPRRYNTGLGYGTDTGPRVTAGVEFRRINRRGHRFRTDILLSSVEQSISSQYLIPIKNVATDNLAFTASASRKEVGGVDTTQFKLGPSFNENWLGFRRRLYLSLERENFDFGDGPQTSNLLIPGAQLSRKHADDALFPRKGYSAILDVHGGIESPLTETTFFQTSINARSVLPLARRSRLLLRGELGATLATTFSDLPPSQRFYAGGDQSVRGYAYQGLGPQNSDGVVIGGKYLTVASIEMDYLFYGNFGAAAFFDAGNASDDFLPSMKRGAGIGLRYRSPVGMIRLDLAHPLDDPDTVFRLHISIGDL
jgi:translocation and assembly module TamA